MASELVEQSLEKTTSGEAGESCVNEAVSKTPLKPGDVQLRPTGVMGEAGSARNKGAAA